jgi:hypothetical protein
LVHGEIGRLIVIERLDQEVALSLMAAGTGAPWNSVPLDARLEDADPEGDLYWAATSLFRHFDDIAGVGLAIASMLRLKRPTFFPILDRYCAGSTTRELERSTANSHRAMRELPGTQTLYWAAIRKDLINPTNRQAMPALRAVLSNSPNPSGAKIAVLPFLRLLDMLAWGSREPTQVSA